MNTKDSERTKRIRNTKIDDDFLGIKKGVKAATLAASEFGDRVGYTEDSPNMKRIKKEEDLKNLSGAEIVGKRSRLMGDDGYGTSLSKGARAAGNEAARKDVSKQLKRDPYKTVAQTSKSADEARRKGEREAAAEERREASPFKKGGWIKGAIKKPGALRASLGAKKGEPIPAKKLAAAAKKPGKMGQRARLAQTLKGFKK